MTAPTVELPVWESPRNRPDNQWYIFATLEARDAKIAELNLTWATLDDRSVLLNYVLLWIDVNGFGVEITHCEWSGTSGSTQR